MRIVLSIVCIQLLISTNAQLKGTSFASASEVGKGNLVFVYNEVSGFTERQGNVAKGFLVDLMLEFEKYVKEKKGIDLTHSFEYADNDFPAFMNFVKDADGGVFGLGNVSIRQERRNSYEFSPPFLDNMSVLVTNTQVASIQNMSEVTENFAGMNGYSIASTTNDERIQDIKEKYLPDLKISYFSSTNEVLEQLAKDENAFAIIDLNFYLEALNKKMPIKRHPAGDESDDPFGIIMPKNSDWAPIMDEFFNSGFIESGRYSEIIAKNLGNSALRLINRIKNQ